MGRGLPTDGTFDGTPPRAHAVLLHDDGNALVAEAVAAGQHCPLKKKKMNLKKLEVISKMK